MRTLTVNIKDNADAKKIADAMRMIKGVEKVALSKETPMRRMTIEEFNAGIDEALEDERTGRVISHEEMGKKIAQWR